MIDRHLIVLASLAKDVHRYRSAGHSCARCDKPIPAAIVQQSRTEKKNLRCSCGALRTWSSFPA